MVFDRGLFSEFVAEVFYVLFVFLGYYFAGFVVVIFCVVFMVAFVFMW